MVIEHSDDESTVNKNGELGTFQLDQLQETAKEFTYVLRGVAPGEFTEPVQTQYGFHILKVNDRQESRPLDFEKDYTLIQKMALENKMQKEFTQWLDEIKKNVYIEIKAQSQAIDFPG